MKKFGFLFLFINSCISIFSYGQETLPNITVKSFNGKVVVSWQNDYTKNISNILIQRSYDSSRNYSTIGTVLNPLNKENGYLDPSPPYDRMYYRISISFEGGTYELGPAVRAFIDAPELDEIDITAIPKEALKITENKITDSEIREKDPLLDKKKESVPVKENTDSLGKTSEPDIATTLQKKILPLKIVRINKDSSNEMISLKPIERREVTLDNKIKRLQWDYPSNRIYINNQNLLIIQLKETTEKKYHIKFYNEIGKLIFEIKKINEDAIFMEKSNFRQSGWYQFEIYNEEDLVEKNKFYISKDKVPNQK